MGKQSIMFDRWAGRFETRQAAWDACEWGEWMLWLAARLSGPPGLPGRRKLVLCVADVLRTGSPRVIGQSRRALLRCCEAAERWARSEPDATVAEIKRAFDGTVGLGYAWHAAYTLWATVTEPDVATIASWAVDQTICVEQAAHAALQRQAAGVVRRHYPVPPTKESS